MELTQQEPEVQRNPLPNHKVKGVVAVVIHGNLAEAKAEGWKDPFIQAQSGPFRRTPSSDHYLTN